MSSYLPATAEKVIRKIICEVIIHKGRAIVSCPKVKFLTSDLPHDSVR